MVAFDPARTKELVDAGVVGAGSAVVAHAVVPNRRRVKPEANARVSVVTADAPADQAAVVSPNACVVVESRAAIEQIGPGRWKPSEPLFWAMQAS